MFERIYGHAMQKEMLEKSIASSRIMHAYLFYGPSGVGKKMLALEFAKLILKTDNLDACPDFKYIERKEDKKDIIVEQVRENISEDIIERPISGSKKVYVINDANLLNISAQNALLKTIEEPPEYAIIILVAQSISSLLPTILSRVSKLEFSSLDKESIKEYVLENNISLNEKIIDFSMGSIGILNEVISKNMIDSFERINEIVTLIEKRDISEAIIKVADVDFSQNLLLSYMQYSLFSKGHYESSLEIERAINRLKMNGNYDIVIDNMIIKCIESL